MALAATEKGVTSFSPGRGNVSVARPLRLHVAGEKPGEGNPADPGQARMQASIQVKVVGLALVQRGYVPAYLPLRTTPDPLASWKMAGTPGRPKGEGRRERCVQVWSAHRDTVDTTL